MKSTTECQLKPNHHTKMSNYINSLTNPTLAEEMAFTHQTESAMCLEEAEQKHRQIHHENEVRIKNALDAGKFVVADEQPVYCRATDAITGTVRYFHSAHDNRAEADSAALKLWTENNDARPEVLPRITLPIPPQTSAAEKEDIPF